MANERTAYVTMQGNVHSRTMYEPSGYQISTPGAFPKTFRTLAAAVLYGVRKGYKVHLVKPEAKSVGIAAKNALLNAMFAEALEAAEAAIAAPVEA